MKKNKAYILIILLTTIFVFGIAAICNQCIAITPATTVNTSLTADTSINNETTATIAESVETTATIAESVETTTNAKETASEESKSETTELELSVITAETLPVTLNLDVPKVIAEGGYIAQDGTPINAGGCLYAGDNDTNEFIVGFISFDITGLANATIQNSSLTFNVKQKLGNPSFYAAIYISDLFWGAVPISVNSIIVGNYIESVGLPSDGIFTIDNAALRTALQASIDAGRPRFQIAVSLFGGTSDNDNSWDGFEWDQGGITLSITYTP